VPRIYEFYPGICLTTEEKARKNLSQGKKNLSQVKKNLSGGQNAEGILFIDYLDRPAGLTTNSSTTITTIRR
jgi:hypothetical protein